MSKRSGTDVRHRKHQIGVRLDDQEHDILNALCAKYGMTAPELLRDGLETLWDIEQQLTRD